MYNRGSPFFNIGRRSRSFGCVRTFPLNNIIQKALRIRLILSEGQYQLLVARRENEVIERTVVPDDVLDAVDFELGCKWSVM